MFVVCTCSARSCRPTNKTHDYAIRTYGVPDGCFWEKLVTRPPSCTLERIRCARAVKFPNPTKQCVWQSDFRTVKRFKYTTIGRPREKVREGRGKRTVWRRVGSAERRQDECLKKKPNVWKSVGNGGGLTFGVIEKLFGRPDGRVSYINILGEEKLFI